jgi:transcription initiation factor IIE alpha subunit
MRKHDTMFKCDKCGKTLTLQEGFEEIKTNIEEIKKTDKFGIK